MLMSVLIHTHRFLCVQILKTPAILPWLREQRSPSRTQLSLAQRMFPQVSVASSHAPRSLVLRGCRAESGPIPETAEKHTEGLVFRLLPRIWCPSSESPTPLPCPQVVPKVSSSILVNKDGLTKRKWSSSFFFFSSLFYAIMAVSLLSCHHRGDVVAGSCGCLPLPSGAAIEDSA